MKTLYVTDLDGTLLNRHDTISDYSASVINRLISRGVCFSYATARSLSSAQIVTSSLNVSFPVIVYNGAFIRDSATGETLSSCYFEEGFGDARETLTAQRIFPLVYAMVDGVERVAWLTGSENEGMGRYLANRKGDRRFFQTDSLEELYRGRAFYLTCIGEREALCPAYERLSADGRFRCTLQQELYRPEYWLEIMPAQVSKDRAVLRLKELAGCDRIVSFGDAVNDIPLFRISDECYAVENAVPELKEIATGILPSNEEDGVARWLEQHTE